ncbi:MAG: hypothetical protein K0S44_193 [Bacteroidetes bacterium]|jgi:hypothetical protein|nr:hypothetical protein [Bacteroidota bacterium]
MFAKHKILTQMAKTAILSPTDLRLKISRLKEGVKGRIDYTTLYEYEYGKQPADVINKIRMVWNLRDVDAEITARLEKIIKKYNKQAV